MDTLSSTLTNLKLESSAAGAMDGAGSWAIEIPRFEGFKLHYLLRGEMWFTLEGVKKPWVLRSGDCLLVPSGRPFVVSSGPSVKRKRKIEDALKTARNGVMTLNGGGESLSIGTHFLFEGHLPRIFFAHLPPAIFIPEHLDKAAILRWSLERFRAEFLGRSVGRALIMNHLAPIILLQILRIYLENAKSERNWLVALADPRLSRAIEAIHSNCARPWNLEKLASVAGMSRSRFALHFKEQVGVPPMDYLTNWRVQIASELLAGGDQTVASVAAAVGYESESAFSAAFTKIMRCRPGQYLRLRADGSGHAAPTAAAVRR